MDAGALSSHRSDGVAVALLAIGAMGAAVVMLRRRLERLAAAHVLDRGDVLLLGVATVIAAGAASIWLMAA